MIYISLRLPHNFPAIGHVRGKLHGGVDAWHICEASQRLPGRTSVSTVGALFRIPGRMRPGQQNCGVACVAIGTLSRAGAMEDGHNNAAIVSYSVDLLFDNSRCSANSSRLFTISLLSTLAAAMNLDSSNTDPPLPYMWRRMGRRVKLLGHEHTTKITAMSQWTRRCARSSAHSLPCPPW